jgi:hypothetical protein
MSTISKQLLMTLRGEIDAALAPLATKHGITLKTGSGSFTPAAFSLKLLGTAVVNGKAVNKEEVDFQDMAVLLGLDKSDLGKTFTSVGVTYKIVGAKPSAYKFPIIGARVTDGIRFKFPSETVIRCLKKP